MIATRFPNEGKGTCLGVGTEYDEMFTLSTGHQHATLAWSEQQTSQTVISLSTANSGANGSNISETGVSYTLDLANSNAVFLARW